MKTERRSARQRYEDDLVHGGEVLTPLRELAPRLRGVNVLEVGAKKGSLFSLLLAWLRPRRLLTADLFELMRDAATGAAGGIAEPDASFQAIFVSLPSASFERELVLDELSRLLAPGGLLVMMRPRLERHQRVPWNALRSRLEALAFEIVAESAGAAWFLIANARAGLRRVKAAPARRSEGLRVQRTGTRRGLYRSGGAAELANSRRRKSGKRSLPQKRSLPTTNVGTPNTPTR